MEGWHGAGRRGVWFSQFQERGRRLSEAIVVILWQLESPAHSTFWWRRGP